MIYMSFGINAQGKNKGGGGGHKVLAVCTQKGEGWSFRCVQDGGRGLEIGKKCIRN